MHSKAENLWWNFWLVRVSSALLAMLMALYWEAVQWPLALGGTQNFWSPSVPDGDEVRWEGDLRKKLRLKPKLPTYAKSDHLLLEIQLFKVLTSLKVVKFDTKMYLNFSNFRGRTSAGGDKPWSKNGDKCRMGGLAKFSPDGGPPRKNPAVVTDFCIG